MEKNYKVIAGVVILILIGFFGLEAIKHNNQPNKLLSVQTTPLPKVVTVVLNKKGFSPKQITVTVGTAVRWENMSGSQQTVNSDNYPTNQLHKELNFGIFNNDSSVAYTFTKPGVYGYHNQFNHQQEGKIIVTK